MSIVYEASGQRSTKRYQVQIEICTSEGYKWVNAEEPYRFKWQAKWTARNYYKSGTDARVIDTEAK